MSSDTRAIVFPCLEATQPIGSFYVGVMNAKDVLDIAYADIRRIKGRDIEEVVGIQRELNRTRVRTIKKYVTHIDATFPTGIILAVAGTDAEYDAKRRVMQLTREPQVAQIIDGQHQIPRARRFGAVRR